MVELADAPTTPHHKVFVLPPARLGQGSELLTSEDLAYWLDQQRAEGWDLVAFGPQAWRPNSRDTVWIFRRRAP